MKTTNLPTTMSRRAELLLASLIIGLSVIYQVHCAIHGFDLTDEGYLMSLYQWFGTDIDFAKGAGGYPLTCYLGWLLNSWTPGILPMRLWGILIVALTEVIVYLYLRRHFNPYFVLAGLFIQAIMVAGDPKPFGYNTLTAFVGILALITILEGSRGQHNYLLFLGGLALGVNVFVRIPNLTCWAFILCPFLVHFTSWKQLSWKKGISQGACILLGALTSLSLTWIWLTHIGADRHVVELLQSITGTLHGKSTHSSASLISTYLGNITSSIIIFGAFILCIIAASYAKSAVNKMGKICLFALSFLCLYQILYIHSTLLGRNLFALMNGIALFGAFPYLFSDNHKRAIAISAFLLSFLIPLGSDGGYQTMWVGTWMALPVGLCGLYECFQNLSNRWTHLSITLSIQPSQISSTKTLRLPTLVSGLIFCTVVMVVSVLIKIERKSYYDPGSRSSKTTAINSPLATGIYATSQRADIINPLLTALQDYVHAGDTILVYDSSPLIYYLTETKPFAGISWPCVYYGQAYVDQFIEAEKSTDKMPLIVLQHFYSSNYWSKVLPLYMDPEADCNFSSIEMTHNLLRVRKQYHYRQVWSNRYYDILMPAGK